MNSLFVLVDCHDRVRSKATYVFDTILPALGMTPVYVQEPPSERPWIYYGDGSFRSSNKRHCIHIAHVISAWEFLRDDADPSRAVRYQDTFLVFPHLAEGMEDSGGIPWDLAANAFFFLSSWSERAMADEGQTRHLYSTSVYARLGIPQSIVDEYAANVRRILIEFHGFDPEVLRPRWPGESEFAVALSHDVDFVPYGKWDIIVQGAKSVMRHLWRERNPADARSSAIGLVRALISGRDPYGCLPEIIQEEKVRGVRSSFQVAVARRHPADVNYDIQSSTIRNYLAQIGREGFELCLHGSYRSTENSQWYLDEVSLLSNTLGRPRGSRQHFLSFHYDALFEAQEKAGIEYDMSMGYPDRLGPRSGFSFPYFPYCLSEDRPYNVLQISLCLMDVTLRSYMGLRGEEAWESIAAELERLRAAGGGVSVVWHPIVFGGARDPGDSELFWRLVDKVKETNGLATDGQTINDWWRSSTAHVFRGQRFSDVP